MSIKINFDAAGNPEEPTIVLAKRNGDRIGKINAKDIELTDNLNDAAETSFTAYKYVDGVKDQLWDKITNFKLVYCVEWNQFFEITVEVNESADIKKTVSCTALGPAELGQIMLYGVEINTEADISRDEYKIPTVLYRENNHEASLLHRIMEKAPHYTIGHVDATIANIQRTFTFDDKSIYDALRDIAEEIDCLFVFSASLDENNKLVRKISAYDLESNCKKCGNRGEFVGKCPKCESTDITEGYGNDTTIFVTADELGDNIQLSTDTDEIKNCFKLEAGDDLMNATIKSCNPNGSDYIWYLSDAMKEDMSDELKKKIMSYDELYATHQTSKISLNQGSLDSYNEIVNRYKTDKNKLENISSPIDGYPSLIEAYYNTMDLYLYLNNSMMPDAGLEGTTAEKEAAKLTADALSPVSTSSALKGVSVSTADSIVLSAAKVLVDSRYKVKIVDGSTLKPYSNSLDYRTWSGQFVVTSYSNPNYVLDIDGGSKSNCGNLQVYKSNNTNAQKWKVKKDSVGYITFINVGSNKALDVSNASVNNGANIWQYEINNTYAQKWIAKKNTDGSLTFVSALDANYVLDINAGVIRNQQNIQLYQSNGTNAQKFKLTKI